MQHTQHLASSSWLASWTPKGTWFLDSTLEKAVGQAQKSCRYCTDGATPVRSLCSVDILHVLVEELFIKPLGFIHRHCLNQGKNRSMPFSAI